MSSHEHKMDRSKEGTSNPDRQTRRDVTRERIERSDASASSSTRQEGHSESSDKPYGNIAQDVWDSTPKDDRWKLVRVEKAQEWLRNQPLKNADDAPIDYLNANDQK